MESSGQLVKLRVRVRVGLGLGMRRLRRQRRAVAEISKAAALREQTISNCLGLSDNGVRMKGPLGPNRAVTFKQACQVEAGTLLRRSPGCASPSLWLSAPWVSLVLGSENLKELLHILSLQLLVCSASSLLTWTCGSSSRCLTSASRGLTISPGNAHLQKKNFEMFSTLP